MIVKGRSYLPAASVGEGKTGGVVDLERNAAVHDVLDGHGVSLAACVQMFDVMQVWCVSGASLFELVETRVVGTKTETPKSSSRLTPRVSCPSASNRL